MKFRKNSRRDQPDGKIPGTSAARDSGVNDPTRAPQSDRPMSFCPASVRLGRSEQAPSHRMLRGIACPGVPNRRLPPIPSATKTQHSDRSVSSEERGGQRAFSTLRESQIRNRSRTVRTKRGVRPIADPSFFIRGSLSDSPVRAADTAQLFFAPLLPRIRTAPAFRASRAARDRLSRDRLPSGKPSAPEVRSESPPRSPAPPLPASRPRPESRVHRPALGFPAAPQKPHARLSPNPRLDATAPLRRYRRSALPPARGTQRNAPAVISRSFSRQRTTRSPSPAPPR